MEPRERKLDLKPKHKRLRSRSPSPLPVRVKHPWKTIVLAFFLFGAGILFLTLGVKAVGKSGWSDAWPFFLLGSLLFIPGGYHSYIIYKIFRGVPGWSYDMIPDMD
mmetsp:Transcript_24572/g.27951  ORF Transcript_24572/g.27951 Transcript_24572/m.27951 type:complete len:106 (+) Transcript_24572:32-349(+)